MISDILAVLATLLVVGVCLTAGTLWFLGVRPIRPPDDDDEPRPGTLLHDTEQLRAALATLGHGLAHNALEFALVVAVITASVAVLHFLLGVG